MVFWSLLTFNTLTKIVKTFLKLSYFMFYTRKKVIQLTESDFSAIFSTISRIWLCICTIHSIHLTCSFWILYRREVHIYRCGECFIVFIAHRNLKDNDTCTDYHDNCTAILNQTKCTLHICICALLFISYVITHERFTDCSLNIWIKTL